MSKFSLAKSRVGVYFNNGKYSYSVQMAPDAVVADPNLVSAIDAAIKAFNAVYAPESEQRKAAE